MLFQAICTNNCVFCENTSTKTATSIESMELVGIAPIIATTYRLCHEVALSDLTTYYVDAVSGKATDILFDK